MQFVSRLLRSVLAGVYIGAGCSAYIITAYGFLENKSLAAILFSFGIFAISYCNLDLFTSRLSMLVTRPPEKLLGTTLYLFNVWFGNFLGCYISAWCMNKTRYSELIHEACHRISVNHINDTPAGLFVAGVGCTIMLYMALRIYHENKTSVYGMIGLIIASLAFICAGFEHTIAAGFFMILGDCTFPERFSALFPIALGNTIGALIPAAIIERTHIDELLEDPKEDQTKGV